MNTHIVACRVVREEMEKAMAETGCSFPVTWVDTEKTHIWPQELKAQLQEVFDGLTGVDRVLLAFGSCGNALLGLRAPIFQLVFPKVDDCISLLLGSCARRQAVIAEGGHSYFMNKGWVDWPINVWRMLQSERERFIARWGADRAERLFRKAFLPEAYQRLVLLDTGVCNIEALRTTTESWAQDLGLRHEVLPGTRAYLEDLLTGPWPPDRFVVLEPGQIVTFGDLVEGAAERMLPPTV